MQLNEPYIYCLLYMFDDKAIADVKSNYIIAIELQFCPNWYIDLYPQNFEYYNFLYYLKILTKNMLTTCTLSI